MNCCRLCSSMTHNAVAIFGDEGVQMKLAYKINKCLPLLVTLSDKLPRHVCRECVTHLDSTSKFITKCLHTQFILEKKLKGREVIPSDEVSVLWSNVNSESTDVPSAILPSGKAIPSLATGNNSHDDDSHDYGSPLYSPAASDEIEIINEGECSEKSAENRAQGNKVVREAPLSGVNEKSKNSNSNVFQEKINHNIRKLPPEKTRSFVSSGIDMSGNKENNVASEQGSTNLKESSLSRLQKRYICKYCNSSFLWRAELFYHQTTSHPAYVFRCRYCLKVFYDSRAEYTKHVAAHKVSEEPKLVRKAAPVSELRLLKQHVSLCKKYNSNTQEESTHKKIPEARNEALPEKRMRESNPQEKPLIDLVVKNLLERKTGGNILGGADNQPILIDCENPKIYKCEWCNNEVQTEEEHHIHLRFFHRLSHPCRLCPRTFKDRKTLLGHEAQHTTHTERKYICRKCNIEFDTEEERKDHKKFHLQEKPVCKICGEKFANNKSLQLHSQVHAEDKNCLCHKCGKAVKYKTSLRMHMKSCGEDPDTAKKYVCKYCGKRYLLRHRLRVHERVHTGEKPFMCSLCGKTFHSNERLKNHSQSHVVENVPCPICGFVMKHQKHLKGHMKSHERAQCKTCGLWFEGSRKLGCHQRVHKKAQVVKDDGGVVMVSKKNVEEENLTESQMMVRFPVVIELSNPSVQDEVPDSIDNSSKIFQQLQKPFACPHCPMKFVLNQSYLKHVKQQHSSTHSQLRKPLYCPDCGGKSQSMDELVRHYYTHFVGSRFYCDVCGESFERKISMIEHKRTHGTNIGPVGDTLLRKRLLRLQPREPLALPSNSKSDFVQISIQEVANHVIVGNPECDGGDYLTFDSQSVDSHCSEVIVVSSENMIGKQVITSDEVNVLWSNENSESTDLPSAILPSGKAILGLVTGNNSHDDDSHDYGSPLNSPAASDEIEIINEGECSEKSAENRAQGNKVVREAPLSGVNEKSKNSNSNVFQEKINHNFRQMLHEKTMSFVSSGIDKSGNKENNVASEQGSTNLKESSLSRLQKKFICKYCNSSFLWRAELFYHQTTSHPAYVFRCRYCLKVFYDSHAEYTKHVAAHKVSEEPEKGRKAAPVSELRLLNHNVSLCKKYNINTQEESTHKKKPEPREEALPEKRMKESNPHEKPLLDVVVKNLLERKTGGNILGGSDNQPILIDCGNPKTYKCEWCNNEVQTEEEHHIHLRFFHRLSHPCRLCPRTFNDRTKLLDHEAGHKKEKKYKCRKCNIEFDTDKERKDHKKFHLQEKAVTCKICGEKFANISGLRQHSQIHAETDTCLCHKCGKALKCRTYLRLHVKSCGEDPESAKKNVCKYCGKRYLLPHILRVHERVHTGEKPYMCSLCGKTFHSNKRLRVHTKSHVVENVPCPICGFVLKHQKDLKGHMKSHERVQCKTCGLWFEGSRKLGCHQRVHKKAQVVKDDGGVVTVSKKNMDEENLTESQMMVRFPVVIELSNPSLQDEVPDSIDNSSKIFQQLQKPFACPHCPMKFVLNQSYLKHVKQQHSSTQSQSRKPLYCPDCGGKSQSMDELVRHYYTHFVGSRFYCDFCGESFERKISMIEHKRTHGTNIGPIGDTLLRKRLLRLQPREPLALPSNSKSDFVQISIQEVANHVVVGNPEGDEGDYLTFDSHLVDSYCSEVIVVSSENMM